MKANPVLVAGVRGCKACPLHLTRTLAVPGWVGSKYDGKIGLVLEAPNYFDDQRGLPLMGRVGILFDSILEELGLSRERFFVTNSVRCRVVDGDIKRAPEAVTACAPWLEKELESYSPRVVLLCGATAIERIFGKVSVGAIRGTYTKLDGTIYVATYHPAAALRNQAIIPYLMADLELARELSDVC